VSRNELMAQVSELGLSEVASARLILWEGEILKVVAARLPGSIFVAVGGSFLTERFNSDSDVDVLALCAGKEAPYNNVIFRCPACENRVLEVNFMPYFRFLQVLDAAPHAHAPKFVRFSTEMVVLKDQLGVAGPLRDHALQILRAGPHVLPQNGVDILRRVIFGVLRKARSCNNQRESEVCRVELSGLLMRATLQWRHCWSSTSLLWTDRMLRELAKNDEFACRLVAAVDSNDRGKLIEIGEELLGNLGGVPDDGFAIRLQ